MKDREILQMIRDDAGRDKGFRLLMDEYQEKLYHHVRRIVGNHEDADDALQNTFIKVYKNIHSFREQSSLYTWLFRISTNEALGLLQKTRRRQMSLVNGITNDFQNQATQSDGPDPEKIKRVLAEAVNSLPDKQKNVFSLRYFEEMSYRQMSEFLDTSEGALKASFHHAVKKIEHYFKTVNI